LQAIARISGTFCGFLGPIGKRREMPILRRIQFRASGSRSASCTGRPWLSVVWYSKTAASISSGTSSPPKRRASAAAFVRLKIARDTSPRAS